MIPFRPGSLGAVVLPFVTLLALFSFAGPAIADELLYADGHRETVQSPRKDSKGHWTIEREGRRVVVKAGEVVAVIDAKGKESVIIPELADAPDSPAATAALASLEDPRNKDWLGAASQLGEKPTRSLHDALVKLSAGKSKEIRGRAMFALANLRTKESVVAATKALLAEKDAATRRTAASAIGSVREIFMRSDGASESLLAGMKDADPTVRFIFASMSPPDTEGAIEILKKDGLGNGDHHVREDAAFELGKRGDASGESILIDVLTRKSIPGIQTDAETMKRVMIREQIAVCEILGKLGTPGAKAALKRAASSGLEPVRKAAEEALAGSE
jgi:HEAT repeat protein